MSVTFTERTNELTIGFRTYQSEGEMVLRLDQVLPCTLTWLKQLESRVLRYTDEAYEARAILLQEMKKRMPWEIEAKHYAATYVARMEDEKEARQELERLEEKAERMKQIRDKRRGDLETEVAYKEAKEAVKRKKEEIRRIKSEATYHKQKAEEMAQAKKRLTECIEYLEGVME